MDILGFATGVVPVFMLYTNGRRLDRQPTAGILTRVKNLLRLWRPGLQTRAKRRPLRPGSKDPGPTSPLRPPSVQTPPLHA